ncbi:MAG TPA: carbohydrate binding domain-containing protein [Chthonomonadaceae bacterium]|nr:carbohydrate binding domain-containing protein [Chthonomonadaceae bacterium]
MKYKVLLIAAVLLGGILATARAQDAPKFPFVLPWDDASKTITDVSALNPTPAGVNGFIRARDGHFYDEKGNRVRFLGVNIVASAAFPDKADAEKAAARLHKYGVNMVRLHHMDAPWAKPNIFDPAFPDTQHLSADSLDRLDYLIYQLKQHGIYVNINLHVSRRYTEADGFPEADTLPDNGKVVTYFMPRMIALQKQYAHDLLTHRNPYTRTRYVDEPCVAVVEVNNENTLLGAAWDGGIDNLPPLPKAELARQWNAWLKEKYKDSDSLKRAWSAADKPFGPNLLQNADFSRGAEHWTLEMNTAPASAKMELPENVTAPPGAAGKVIRIRVTTLGGQNWHIQFHQPGLDLTEGEPYTVTFWARADRERPISVYTSLDKADWHNVGLSRRLTIGPQWQKFTCAFTAARTLKDHNRLTFVLGDALGTVDLAGPSLRPGVETEFPSGASLEAGNMPLGHPVANPAGQDWIAFLVETERRYMTGMRDYIKNDLKAHANVAGSQASYGGLGGALRESQMDFTDMHAYWQHPNFPHKPWDPVDWRIPNTSMTRASNGGTLPELARYRIAGKPFTVSEYNHPAPNDYQAECVLMLAAYAALQDWDGLYLFDYNSDRNAWNSDKIKGFFSVDTNPAKMAFLPAAAMLFLRDDMPLANGELRLRVPPENVVELLAKNGPDVAAEWDSAGIGRLESLTQRLSVSFAPGQKPDQDSTPKPRNEEDFINKPSGRGPIDWQPSADQPLFIADSPSSKLVVGFLGGRSVQMPGWLVQAGETPRNFAALTLTAMDGQPVDRSHSLLLTAVDSVENTGMEWNADRTSVGDRWGTGPTLVEGVPATVAIRTVVTYATVYALDGTGKRIGTVDSKLSGGLLTFAIGPANKTLWYEIEAGLKR